jgi:hypothetical protein
MAGKTEIGALSVRLSADAAQFHKAVDGAGARLASLTKAASSPLTAGVAPLKAVEQGFAPLQRAIQDIPLIGAAMGSLASPEGFFKAFKEEAKTLVLTSRAASGLGLSTGQLIALEKAAGPAAESVIPALRHLSRELGAVAMGSAEAEKRFSQFGLSGQQLVKAGTAGALDLIAARAAKLPGVFETNRLAFEAFGKKGQELLPMLEKLQAGLGTLEGKAIAQGLVPTQKQLDDLKIFIAAQKEADNAVAGLKRQALLAGSGRMAAIAHSVEKDPGRYLTAVGIAGALGGAGGAVLGGIGGFFAGGPPGAVAGAMAGGSLGATAAAGVVGIFGPPAVDKKKYLEAAEREIRDMEAAFDKAKRDHFQGVIESLKVQADTMRMAGGAAAEYKAKLQGANEAEGAMIKSWTDWNALLAKGKAAEEAAISPMERIKQNLNEMADLYNRGKLSTAAFGNSMLKAKEELERAYGGGNEGPLNSLVRGSQAYRSFDLELERKAADAKKNENPVARMNELFKMAAVRDAKRDQLLQQIVDGVRNNANWIDPIDKSH